MARDVHPVAVLDPSSHVVVVGAGLAGWRLVEALRREGYTGRITVVGGEVHRPYDRPPLSKQVLAGKLGVLDTELVRPGSPNDIEWRLGVEAVGIDVGCREVALADGSSITGTHVAIATGVRARTLSTSAGARVHALRTREDVERLLRDVEIVGEGASAAVIGGGFIGAEVATSLRARGLRVVVLEMAARPLVNVVGEQVAAWLEHLARDAGVELRTGQVVRDVERDANGLRVRIDDDHDVVASLVVAGVGAVTNVEWLAGSGLAIENGVVVDENLQAAEGVAALGDVARFVWAGPLGRELARIEHWQVANDHAVRLAHVWITGEPVSSSFVPYFWSDQYGKKIQMLGHPDPRDEVERVFNDSGRWLALYHRRGVVTGVVALSFPRGLMLAKPLVEVPTLIDAAVERAVAAIVRT